jgi:hypothetical protein
LNDLRAPAVMLVDATTVKVMTLKGYAAFNFTDVFFDTPH